MIVKFDTLDGPCFVDGAKVVAVEAMNFGCRLHLQGTTIRVSEITQDVTQKLSGAVPSLGWLDPK